MTPRLWLVPLGGALLAPLLTWLPELARRFPSLGLPPYEGGQGIDLWHMQAFWGVLALLVSLLVGVQDRWLGLAVAMVGGGIFLWGGTVDNTHRMGFIFGALVLWALRRIPVSRRALVLTLLAASGLFQAVYVIQQALGADVLFCPSVIGCGGWLPTGPSARPLLVGTIGTVDAATAYVAITAPLMPRWGVPIAVLAVLAGHSLGAILALAVGLLLRYHRTWWGTGLGIGALLLGLYWYAAVKQQWHVPSTVSARIAVWKLALWDWWATDRVFTYQTANPLFGAGQWSPRIPVLQQKYDVLPTKEFFAQAHNEFLEWAYTYGVVGVTLCGAWLWTHRRMFLAGGGVGAALVALAVASGSFFTFQVVSVALLALVLIGLATPDSSQEVA